MKETDHEKIEKIVRLWYNENVKNRTHTDKDMFSAFEVCMSFKNFIEILRLNEELKLYAYDIFQLYLKEGIEING